MTTLDNFIAEHKVTLHADRVDRNPHMDKSDQMDNWKCKLRVDKRSMVVYFSKGFGHHGATPTAAEVLDCLASDAAGYENAGDFESWASEYGYDTDSRRAERTYTLIEKQAARLMDLFGYDDYQTLLFHTERM